MIILRKVPNSTSIKLPVRMLGWHVKVWALLAEISPAVSSWLKVIQKTLNVSYERCQQQQQKGCRK